MKSFFIGLLLIFSGSALAQDPLPAWNDGPSKKAIIRFVQETTQPNSKQFVPPEERIAVFDNDGTLWSEQPLYVQLAFAIGMAQGKWPTIANRLLANSIPHWI